MFFSQKKYAYLVSCLALFSTQMMAKDTSSSQQKSHSFDMGAESTFFAEKKGDNQINRFNEWEVEANYGYVLNSKIDLSAHTEYKQEKIETKLDKNIDKARFISYELGMNYKLLPTWSHKTTFILDYAYAPENVSMSDSRTYKIKDKLSKTFTLDTADVTLGFEGSYKKGLFDKKNWSWLASMKWSFEKACFELEGNHKSFNYKMTYHILDDVSLTAKYDQTSTDYLYSPTQIMSMKHDLMGLEAKWGVTENLSVMLGADYLYNGSTSLTTEKGSDTGSDMSNSKLAHRMAYHVGFNVHF